MLKIREKLLPLFIISNLAAVIWNPPQSSAQGWQELKGKHFIVYFTQDERFAQLVLDSADTYYRKIAVEIGYPRYSGFWLWDNRVKIYIYPDRDFFLAASKQPPWSHGMADYGRKEILSYRWSEGFIESLLPHEIAHLIFRDFVGFKGEIPLWLDEGVAQWAEEAKRQEMKSQAKQLFERDSLISLEDMMRLDIRRVTEEDRVYIRPTRTKTGSKGVVFLSGDNLIKTYYLQSFSLVGFLIERFGSSRFADFCRQMRDAKAVEEALRSAYSPFIRSIRELEDRWRDYLAN